MFMFFYYFRHLKVLFLQNLTFMNKRFFPAILLSLIAITSQAQDKNFKTWFQQAQEQMLYENYQEALKKYMQIENRGQLNANVAFNMGICYMNLDNQVENAIPYLEKDVGNMRFSLSSRASHSGAAPGILISIRIVSSGISGVP